MYHGYLLVFKFSFCFRNPAYQDSIPESHDEAENDAEQVPADSAEDAEEEFVDAAQPRVQNERASRQKSSGNNEPPRGNQRTTKISKADQVSQMRGYSTLPRSRNQRSTAISAQQVYICYYLTNRLVVVVAVVVVVVVLSTCCRTD